VLNFRQHAQRHIVSKLVRYLTHSARFNPESYWQLRHEANLTALTGVGHINLTNEQNQTDYKVKVAEVLSALSSAVGDLRGKRILDAGCGIGIYSAALLARGAEVFGVDFTPKAINLARRENPGVTFSVASLDTLCFKENFDCVLCIDVLFHVVEDSKWESALTSLVAAVKPDGALLIQEFFGVDSNAPEPHVRWRTQRHYQNRLGKLGATISTSHSYELPAAKVTKTILVVHKQH
jgi:SAM-dependent methyltransferase